MSTLNFIFHECNHGGYLEVPLELLRQHKISKLISNKSYLSDDYQIVYCEDMHDMGIVLTRLHLDGIKFNIDNCQEDDSQELIWIELLEPYNGDYNLGEIPQNTSGLEEFIDIFDEDDFDLED